MTAALLTEPNQPLRLEEVTFPDLNVGQVKVKVLMSGICGAQLQEIRGEKGQHFPRMLGHEGCGEVMAIGPGVRHVRPGDKVVMHWRKGAGIESESPLFKLHGDEQTCGQVTTFAEMTVCSENRLTRVPRGTPPELCALLGCGLSTALGVMENDAKLRIGERVLIVGCGGVGLSLIRVAKMMGAAEIHVIENHPDKVENAMSAGASRVRETSSALEGYDVIVDTTGCPEVISKAFLSLRGGGRFIMVGQPKPGADLVLTSARHFFEGEGKRIIASQGGQFNPTVDISRYVNAFNSGFLSLTGLISHKFALREINQALDIFRSGNAGRVMIDMQ